jgi:hypothetical protein
MTELFGSELLSHTITTIVRDVALGLLDEVTSL